MRGRATAPSGEAPTKVPVPKINYDFAPADGYTLFANRFRAMDDDQWCQLIEETVDRSIVDGVNFPQFPEQEFQERVHGHSGRDSMREAAAFFRFIKAHTYGETGIEGKRALDFGCGWGRIIRFFMRDFALTHLFGFEPNFLFCSLARSLNPYVTFFSGPYLPEENLPANYFHLVFGWSVFSHLSQHSAQLWLNEMARILAPGGHCVFTTWGDRFLLRLLDEADQQRNGQKIHWYSELCISKAGSIDKRLDEYNSGRFVWWNSVDNPLYGEAFVSKTALSALLAHLPLQIVCYDKTSLAQDVFVLQKV